MSSRTGKGMLDDGSWGHEPWHPIKTLISFYKHKGNKASKDQIA
jgi:hypothetical protein